MRRTAVLGIFVLLAALVGGAIYWKSRDAEKPAPLAGATDAGIAAPASAAKPAPTGESAPPAAAGLRHDDDPPGKLRLEGQVVDADELPVGGALVAIDAHPARTAKTEADGSFAFEGLLQRRYRVEAYKDDAHAGPTVVNVVAKTEPVTLRLAAGVALEITVHDAEKKKPIAGARVQAREIATIEATAGADGVARLSGLGGGWVSVKVEASGYAPAFEVFQIARTPGGVQEQTVLLRRGAAVAGRVVDAAGKAVAGARVLPVSASNLFGGASVDHDTIESDAQGRWKLAAVAPGSWRFAATHERHAPGSSATVIVEAGRAPAEVVITLPPAGSVRGVVQSAAGQPVPFASVRAVASETSFGDGRPRAAYADEAGRFEMHGLPRAEVDVLAAHESGSSEVTVLDLQATPAQENVVLVLAQDGTISGTVVTPAGQAVAEARIFAMPELGEEGGGGGISRWQLLGNVSDVSDQAGAFRLTGLPKGKYRLRAMRGEASMSDASTWQRKSVLAEPGATGVRVVLEEDAVVKGKLAFKDGTSPEIFTVATSILGAPTPFSSKTGEFRLEGVAPGTRVLTVGPGFARKSTDAVEVKPGVETDVGTIVVARGRTVRGKVVDSAGAPVAGALVLAGPRFVGSGDSLKGAGDQGAAFGTKEAESDAEGRFELPGQGVKNLLVVADHERGRSATQPIGAGEADVNLTLTLVPTGAIEGKVMAGTAPVAKAMVIAQAPSAYRGQILVQAGEDGIFRFDRLAPDTYLVSALRPQGIAAFQMQTEVVKLESGKTAQVTIELVQTELSLELTVTSLTGEKIQSAVVFLVAGTVSPKNPVEVEAVLAQKGAGNFQQGLVMGGKPHRFVNLVAGAFSVCVLPVAGDLRSDDAEAAMGDPDAAPVTCLPVVVAAQPNEQKVTVPVPAPKKP